MIRLFLAIACTQITELKKHFLMNGYHVEWINDDAIDVDVEEVVYVKTILQDRGIGYIDALQ